MRNTTDSYNAPDKSLLWYAVPNVRRLPGWLFCFLVIDLTVQAAPSYLDPTFGNGGKAVSSPDGSETTFGLDYALQPGGKIIAVGGGSSLGFLVVRYNSNGSLDTTFGTNGLASVTFPDQSGLAAAVNIQTDGKIVVGGTISRVVNNLPFTDLAVARFNSNGSPDTTFDGGGKMTFSFVPEIFSYPAQENLSSIKIAGDGKIVGGGSAGRPGAGGRA